MTEDHDTGKTQGRRGAAMADDTLRLLVDDEVGKAENWAAANIRGEQERNLQYYLGMPLGNEVEGRSQVMCWDVFEVIESAMPSFIEPFFSGDNIGAFQPRGPNDEGYAEQATDVCNFIIKDQNPGYNIFSCWIKDALLSKIGIVRAEWEEQEPKKIELEDLSDDQFALLMQDGESKLVEHSAKPDEDAAQQIQAQYQQAVQQWQQAAMQAQQQGQQPPQQPQMPQQMPTLHDVTVLQDQDGRVCIENVRPENFVISRGAKSLARARCVGEFIVMTRSELEEEGYEGAYTVSDFAGGDQSRQQMMQMLRDDLGSSYGEQDSSDKSMEEITLFRGFIRADVNGDGIAEYRRVLVGGNMVLDNEEADGPDYAIITPIPIPHRVIGMAYADPAAELQRLSTTLTRQYLDSLYAANNPRTYVNMNSGVNLDDLLSTRINGIIRGNGPAGDAIQPIQTTLVSRDALEGIQLAQTMRESRLGITRYNQGLDSETLNKTATGIQKVMGAADKRQQMTLRNMAETGVKDLFKLVLRLVTKYQEKAATIRLRGEWVEYDPRQWSADMDATVDVGIGSGDKTETLVMLQQFGQYMQWAQTVGAVTPQNVFEFGKALAKNGKLRDADTKLLTQPPANPPPPPQDPKIAAEAQKVQFMAQHQEKMKQMDLQDAAQKFQAEQQTQMRIDQNRQEWEARQKQMELQQMAQLEQVKAEFNSAQANRQFQFDEWKASLDAQTRKEIAHINAGVALQKADNDMQKHEDGIVMGGYQSARDDAAEARESARGEE
jgi:hypothetical protein